MPLRANFKKTSFNDLFNKTAQSFSGSVQPFISFVDYTLEILRFSICPSVIMDKFIVFNELQNFQR